MKHVKLLDCTLRDGAYLIDKEFGNDNIAGIIDGLVNAKVDYIEIGFFQDDGFGDGKTVFKNSADARRFIPNDKQGCMFTVLADYSRFSIENLDDCTGDSIDAVRECFFKKERFEALEYCKTIIKKGYKCFVQPVDILGYSDIELIEFLQAVNEVEPYCLSIVDTFGSMYQEDLHRIFEIINHNLIKTCKIGFHSHNNMQMSSALSQEFVRMTYGKREAVVDGTISGMGRGAGNTPTELIAQYMVDKHGYTYNIDALLDVIDDYMDNIKARCTWGYTTPYFIAGSYSAHVNNIAYLTQKSSIRSKDIRYLLNKIGTIERKRYDYGLIEKTYVDYLESDIDDTITLNKLRQKLSGREVLILVPGNSISTNKQDILTYISQKNPFVICVSFTPCDIKIDCSYYSNTRRYHTWKNREEFIHHDRIIASNIKKEGCGDSEYIVSFNRLIKCGWEHLDNSTLMLLRLLDMFDLTKISIAGFDGYNYEKNGNNYVSADLELSNVFEDPAYLNNEISEMLKDYMETRERLTPISFITHSRFEKTIEGN